MDAVEQFQVVTSGAQAELGRALGGYVSIVTKSGTNVLHGTGYDYFRDDSFNARNPLLGHEAAHGPVRSTAAASADRWSSNRTFYFANVEQRGLDQTGLTTISTTSSVAAINARLAAVGYRRPVGRYRRLSESDRLD